MRAIRTVHTPANAQLRSGSAVVPGLVSGGRGALCGRSGECQTVGSGRSQRRYFLNYFTALTISLSLSDDIKRNVPEGKQWTPWQEGAQL